MKRAFGRTALPLGTVVALLLSPLGLEALPLRVMDAGIGWILAVASELADWPGAVGRIVAPGSAVLPLTALGGCVVCLSTACRMSFG